MATPEQRLVTEAKLTTTVGALTYDSGWRSLTATIPAAQYVSGNLYVRRLGLTVWVDVLDLVLVDDPASTSIRLQQIFPIGFRPPRTTYFALAQRTATYSPGPWRIDQFGSADFYNSNGETLAGQCSFLTSQASPSVLPGTPA